MKNLVLFVIGVVNLISLLFINNNKWVPVGIITGLFCIYYSVWAEREKTKSFLRRKKELRAFEHWHEEEVSIYDGALKRSCLDNNMLSIRINDLEKSLEHAEKRVNMQVIMNESGLVSDAKFGKERMFTGSLEKAKEEIQQAIDSGKIEKFAGILICVFDAARKKGYNMKMLFRACMKKINILWNSELLSVDATGVTTCIKGDKNIVTNGNEPSISNVNV